MASGNLRAELECSVCLNTYTDPVTLRCGHNFCRDCIGRVLDTQERSGGYSCPECREEFQERPALHRNITLRNIEENFLSAQPDQEESGVLCTQCYHTPVPAVKSCLLCEASLCDNHLRVHSKSPEHVLCDPTTSLENRKCSVHKKILEYYCAEDSACICVSCCLIGGHKGHKMESLDEASEKKKKNLRNVLQKLMTEREETERRVQSLEEHRRKVQGEAAGETERVIALLRDLRRRLEDLEKRVLSEISGQAERTSLYVTDMIRELEIKKDELSRKMRHIEELCNMTDPLTVLQESDTGDLCDTEDGDDEDRERHDRLLHDGGDLDVAGITHTLHTGISDIMSGQTRGVSGVTDILLDVNTASNNLHISHDRKTATWSDKSQNRPETPERFGCSQVLSSQSFSSGRHYWEVDVGGSQDWRVGMCYPSIWRRGYQSEIGYNKQFWGLGRWLDDQYSVIHGSNRIRLPGKLSSNRVRIDLDYEAGRISFYDLCDPIRHLRTFTTTFTEPLHAAVCVGIGSYIKISGGNQRGHAARDGFSGGYCSAFCRYIVFDGKMSPYIVVHRALFNISAMLSQTTA
ncbi:PREDICTED: E3 ubiquitin-protein ligase TRIM39-like [Nanorana parkeri]|uniref:E3 ubiquitin-protein ligase TRIM39-like n=1 Tax=Nanorana parkeri TaxID=125878 RepID=UPI0008550B5B|nr:PREDICTED: E3 ubiquitin-protein ligase TRIM39-like [Nanorana parkeri]